MRSSRRHGNSFKIWPGPDDRSGCDGFPVGCVRAPPALKRNDVDAWELWLDDDGTGFPVAFRATRSRRLVRAYRTRPSSPAVLLGVKFSRWRRACFGFGLCAGPRCAACHGGGEEERRGCPARLYCHRSLTRSRYRSLGGAWGQRGEGDRVVDARRGRSGQVPLSASAQIGSTDSTQHRHYTARREQPPSDVLWRLCWRINLAV